MFRKIKSVLKNKYVPFELISKKLIRRIELKREKEETVEDILNSLKPINFSEYTFNSSIIEEFYDRFRNHQIKTIKAIADENIGQINNPTGTGKTFIQKYIHVQDMVNKTKKEETGVYIIAAHRLILCSQLFDEIIDLIVKCGLKTDLLYIGSSRYPFGRLNYDYKEYGFDKDIISSLQTTSAKEVEEFVARSRREKHHTLIVATYHSFDCLKNISDIDICTFDEAHTTVEQRFTDNIELVMNNINKKFFFTATRKVIGDDLGQNNLDFYGPVLYEMSPRQAVEAGEIVQPRIHIVKTTFDETEIDKKKNVGMLVRTVVDSFNEHEIKVKEFSVEPDKIAGKLLVTNSGLDEIENIVTDDFFQNWSKENNINIFSFSSRQGQTACNFENNISREEMLIKMGELKSEDRAILFHYDILTEGIDLPAITGVMLLRSTIPFIKLLQNLGRACRLHPEDRQKLYSKEILPNQYKKMIKPFSWVILPTYINENWKYVKDTIRNLRVSYNIPIENVSITDISNTSNSDSIESILEKNKNRVDMLKDIEHVFETIEIEDFEIKKYNVVEAKRYVAGYVNGVE